jgi:hypothetical protein
MSAVRIPIAQGETYPMRELQAFARSIQPAIDASKKTILATAAQTSGNFASEIAALQAEVAALQAAAGAAATEYTCLQNIAAYQAVYELLPSVVSLADSSALSTSTGVIGLAQTFGPAGQKIEVFGDGQVAQFVGWSWSVGPVYLGLGGLLTQTRPTSGYVVRIGYAISATSVFIAVSTPTPAFAYSSNPGTVVTSTSANNVVDTRPVLAGEVAANQVLEAVVRVYISGTNNTKSLLVGLSADLSHALTAVFTAAQQGVATFTVVFLAAASGNTHTLISRVDFQSTYGATAGGSGVKRGTVSANLATTAFNLVTEAWVANASDSITIDSVSWSTYGNTY